MAGATAKAGTAMAVPAFGKAYMLFNSDWAMDMNTSMV